MLTGSLRKSLFALSGLVVALLTPLATALPALATPPGTDGDLVFSGVNTAPIHGIYTLNPADVSPVTTRVEEGNAVESTRGGIGPTFSPGGLLAMSLPDGAHNDKPTIFTGTRTYKTDNTQLKPVPTNHVADYDPAWSADGSRLAFTGVVNSTGATRIAYQHQGDIWSMNPDGGDKKRLTTSGPSANNDAPAWKPDGTALAFTGFYNSVQQLALVSPDGSGFTLLKPGQDGQNPAWSPDGTKIAFDSFSLPGDTTTHAQIAVLDVGSGAGAGTITQLTTDAAHDNFYPTWSPDGTKIAFESYDQVADVGTIQTVPATGGSVTTITSGHNPAWSPNGTKLAFNKESAPNNHDIYTVAATGGTPVKITTSPALDYDPSWSNDGTKLTYISDGGDSGHPEVWSINVNGGTGATELTTVTSGADSTPAWSPPLTTSSSYVFVANADGSNVQVVTLAIDGGNPAWSPDTDPSAQRIAFTDGGRVFTIQPNGLDLTAVTTSSTPTTADADPSYSPDGNLIAFSGKAANGDQAIYTIGLTGLGLTKVVGSAGDHDVAPVWSPLGTRIAFINGSAIYTVGNDGNNLHLVKDMGADLTPQSLDWGSVGAPDTVIDSGPSGTFGGHDPTFTFSSSRSPATFECMLEASGPGGEGWTDCTPAGGAGSTGTKTYTGLAAGTYTFRVRASNGVGTDATPASSQFTVAPPGVVVSLAGSGAGTVTSNPSGIKCSPSSTQCIAVFNGSATLTAKADGLSTFTGWSGDCTGTGQCTVNAVNESKHVTATFDVSGNGPPACTGTSSIKTVNDWSVKGCFTGSGSSFTTDQLVELNGLKVYPTDTTLTLNTADGTLTSPAGSQVSVLAGPTTVPAGSAGGPGSAAVTSTKVGPINLSVGPVALNLKATSITLATPPGGSLLGLPLSGSVTLSTPSSGTVKVDLHVTLQPVLGGGTVTAHLTSDATSGLHVDSIAVGPIDATLATLFRLKNATFTYQAGTGWSAGGTVLVPGGSGTFSAKFVYAGDVLQKADVVLTKVTIGGFLDASSFQIHYLNGNWSASATVNHTNTVSGSLTFQGGALQTMHLTATHLNAFGVVGVNGFDLSYDSASGWSVNGQVVSSAVNGSFSGTFTYADGVLTTAHIGVASLDVGKLFSLSGLNLDYDTDGTSDHWHGDATLGGQGGQAISADFVLSNGSLTSAALSASDVPLFGIIDVANFHFGYNSTGSSACSSAPTSWGISGNVSVPGASTFAVDAGMGFDAVGGLSCGHLHVAKAKLAAVIDVNNFLVDFASGGTWSGTADVEFPGGLAVKANVAFVNGALTQLGGAITAPGPGLPLGPSGVFLHGGNFQLQTSPQWQITGGLDITGGPTVPVLNVAAVGIDGLLQLRFPSGGQAAGMRVSGTAHLANLPLAEGYVDYTAPLNVDVAGCLGTCANGLQFANGFATVKASVVGKVRGTQTFQVTGDAEASLHFKGCLVACVDKTVGVSGSVIASNIGVAACGHITGMSNDWAAGFGYKWGKTPEAFSGCSLSSYQTIPTSPSHLAGTGGTRRLTAEPYVQTASSTNVPAGLPVQAFRFTGAAGTAPPFVTLTGPDKTISARYDTAGVGAGYVVTLDRDTLETVILVDHPTSGTWTATLQNDSSPLASATQASGLPAPDVTGGVTGQGTVRAFIWSLTPHAGQVIQFVENGTDSSQVLATTSAASGNVPFTPAAGTGGTRTIVAEVTQDGLPRASIDVATYAAPARAVLTVIKQGAGSGTVTSAPVGITCGPTCSTDITPAQSIQLTATPASGMKFAGWGGLCSGASPTCTVAPTESSAVTATFAKLPPPTVTGFTPAAAKPGATVTLTGTQFAGTTKVAFGKVQAHKFSVLPNGKLTAVVPTGALTGKISVTGPSGVGTSAKAFKVVPVVTSFTPTSAKAGTKVTINGSALAGATKVTFGGVVAKIVSSAWAKVVVIVPKTAKTGRLNVTTIGGTATSTKTFTIKKH